MNTDFQKFPTQFYGRTWIYWLGVMVVGALAAFGCVGGLLFCFDIMNLGPRALPGWMIGSVMIPIGLTLTPFAIAFVVQVITRQSPTLKICREGIWIRFIETPIKDEPILQALQLDMVRIIFVMFWRLVMLQMFQTPIYRLRWENIETIRTDKGVFTLGWRDTEYNDFDNGYSIVSCPADFFWNVHCQCERVGTTLSFQSR